MPRMSLSDSTESGMTALEQTKVRTTEVEDIKGALAEGRGNFG